MTPTAKPLAGARLKIERAKHHVHNIEREIISFIETNPYSVSRHIDPNTGDEVYRVNILKEIPSLWSCIIGDAIHNMRVALDLLATAIVASNGGNKDRAYFPFGDTPDAFETELKRKVKGATQEAIDLIRIFKPYKGGNKPLWQIHRLDRLDKHQSIIPTGTLHRNVGVNMGEAMRKARPDIADKVPDAWVFLNPADRQYGLKDGAEVYRILAAARDSGQGNVKLTFDIAFGEGQILEGEPVMPTLVQFGQLTEQIINTFGRVIFNESPK